MNLRQAEGFCAQTSSGAHRSRHDPPASTHSSLPSLMPLRQLGLTHPRRLGSHTSPVTQSVLTLQDLPRPHLAQPDPVPPQSCKQNMDTGDKQPGGIGLCTQGCRRKVSAWLTCTLTVDIMQTSTGGRVLQTVHSNGCLQLLQRDSKSLQHPYLRTFNSPHPFLHRWQRRQHTSLTHTGLQCRCRWRTWLHCCRAPRLDTVTGRCQLERVLVLSGT